tara:strand:+ start:194 stop:589 length:396 start_codon:yes stop_codon:yes gene_type:complete
VKQFRLSTPTARQLAASYCLEGPQGWLVTFREPTRSLEQNALMWARLTQISDSVKWDGETLTPNEWKDLLTACLRKQKVVRGIEGGLVFLGARTSSMSKSEMADLLTLMEAFAAERGLTFRDQVEALEHCR